MLSQAPIDRPASKSSPHRAPCIRKLTALLSLLLVSCASQRPYPSFRLPPNLHDRTEWLYAYGDAGFGLPTGLVGAGVGLSPVRWASFEVGGGLTDSGPQASGMASARMRVYHTTTLGLASGLSVGMYDDEDADFLFDEYAHDYHKTWDWVLWSNSEMQVRGALSENTAIRGHFGVGFPVGAAVASCDAGSKGRLDLQECFAAELPDVVPYLGIGVEYDF